MGFDYSVRLGLMCFFHYNSVSFLLFSFKRFTPQCLRVCTRVQWQPEQTWSLISWGFWSHGEVDINTVIILVVTYLQSDARAVKKRKRKTCLQLIKERTPDWWGCSASLNMMSEQRTEPWCGRNPTERRRRMGRVAQCRLGAVEQGQELGLGENLVMEVEADKSQVSGLCNQVDYGATHSSNFRCGQEDFKSRWRPWRQ